MNTEKCWCKDGTSFAVECSSMPALYESGRVNGAVVLSRDITERESADDAVRSLNIEYSSDSTNHFSFRSEIFRSLYRSG